MWSKVTETPEFEVVIPCHASHFRHIPRLLTAISSWSLQPTGVTIVVSSVALRSTDNLRRLLQDLPNPELYRTIFVRGPRSAGANRNLGIDLATSEYVMLLDADDEYACNYPSEIFSVALASNADIVLHSFHLESSHSPNLDRQEHVVESARQIRNATESADGCGLREAGGPLATEAGFPLAHGVLTMRSEVAQSLRYSDRRMGQDVEFLRKALVRDARIAATSQALMTYRRSLSSNTRFSRRVYRRVVHLGRNSYFRKLREELRTINRRFFT